MTKIGFWRTKLGYVSHKNGLTQEQVNYLQNLKQGDRLVLFQNDVREGENDAVLTLKRSTFVAEVK